MLPNLPAGAGPGATMVPRRAIPSRWALVLATAALTVLLPVIAGSRGVGAATSPIHPDNRPTPLPGQTNGEVADRELITVEGSCRLARAAAPSMALLLATARRDGVALAGGSCYRPAQRQTTLHGNACSAGQCACVARPGFSMHGWGKAVDLTAYGRSLTSFQSPAYRWLVANAGRFGWNQPGWARQGGSACPEPWHWEWVGDGGTMRADPVRADVVALTASRTGAGYRVVTGLGALVARGDATNAGSAADIPLARLVVGSAATPSGNGYWMVATDGGVFSFGDAEFFGSTGNLTLNQPIVGMAPTPTGRGYWLVAADGGIFTFGDAPFLGSTGNLRLNQPIVGMAATRTGRGYWLVAADGGIFTFGDAAFLGSTGDLRLNDPVVGMAATPTGRGYWMVAGDGGLFTFGDAGFFGSAAASGAEQPFVGMAATPGGQGYWLVDAAGTVAAFGNATFHGAG